MSIAAMDSCWGNARPDLTPVERLVALALADSVNHDDDVIIVTPNVLAHLAAKCGLPFTLLEDAVAGLHRAGVLDEAGTGWRWLGPT